MGFTQPTYVKNICDEGKDIHCLVEPHVRSIMLGTGLWNTRVEGAECDKLLSPLQYVINNHPLLSQLLNFLWLKKSQILKD